MICQLLFDEFDAGREAMLDNGSGERLHNMLSGGYFHGVNPVVAYR